MLRGFGPPGPRTYSTREENESTELWLIAKSAFAGALSMDAILLVLLVGVLLAAKVGLFVLGVALCLLVGRVFFHFALLPDEAYMPLLIMSSILGIGVGVWGINHAWPWLALGIEYGHKAALVLLAPWRWHILLALGLVFFILWLKTGDPKIGFWLVIFLAGVWEWVYFVLEPTDWTPFYLGAAWARLQYVAWLLALPFALYALLFGVRMFVEVLAGNVLPVQVMPVDYLELGGPLGLLFPRWFGLPKKEGDPVPVPAETFRVEIIHLTENGKPTGDMLYGDVPIAQGDELGFERWAAAVLHGMATISESGSKGKYGLKGATHFGYTQAQWRGKATNADGTPQPGLRETLQRLSLIETDNVGHRLTDEGKLMFARRAAFALGTDAVPESYRPLVLDYAPSPTGETDE